MNSGKSILITGGTGSFGRAMLKELLDHHPVFQRIVILSRDELKQYEMSAALTPAQSKRVRFFLGDVRDRDRLTRALEGVNFVVHAAALKQVPVAEYNPIEFIKTNIFGVQNLIEACLDSKVEKVVSLSTDKAAAPVNLYGATKLCADKLIVAANSLSGYRPLRFSVVRYGNVMFSRGSVIPLFLKCRPTGVLPITHADMTRFNISLKEGVDMVLWALENARGGEIFVPKIPSYRIIDVATAIGPECRQEIVGIRPGEKIHEEMITESDSFNTVDLGRYYAILPASAGYSIDEYCHSQGGEPTGPGFVYNSAANPDFLSVERLRELITAHVASVPPLV
jgi:UDP-N-acetylglucosamine 4,6-dehydratase